MMVVLTGGRVAIVCVVVVEDAVVVDDVVVEDVVVEDVVEVEDVVVVDEPVVVPFEKPVVGPTVAVDGVVTAVEVVGPAGSTTMTPVMMA